MLLDKYPILVYLAAMTLIWALFSWRARHVNRLAVARKEAAISTGMNQPPTLHPVIDPNLCRGCGACVTACPEGEIIGLIDGRAELIEAANCIGHGACKAACPFDAIDLVFGTAERGVDIPQLSPEFFTTRDGVSIAGELGGMGLIRNAITQGVQATEQLVGRLKNQPAPQELEQDCDLLIVGAGPAGIAAALTAKKHGISAIVVEQGSLGGTVAHFPRNKIVMTAPVELPLVGKVNLRETSKESLLEFWQDIIEQHKPDIRFGEQLIGLEGEFNQFTGKTSVTEYRTRAVLLCLGRRGTPRKLDIPGEELSHVIYSLTDASHFAGRKAIVIGGGDSAIEAALALAEQPQTSVTLSYRGSGFNRAKAKNRQALEQSSVDVRLNSAAIAISSEAVTLREADQPIEVAADLVVICAGGILPTPFLAAMGIEVETKYGSQ